MIEDARDHGACTLQEIDEDDVAAEMRFLEHEVDLREVDLRLDELTAFERYRPE